MSFSLRLVVMVSVVSLLVCCSSEEPPTTLPSLASCSRGWETLYTRADFLEPSALAYAGQTLLFPAIEGDVGNPNADYFVIQALSTSDGVARTLVVDSANHLWPEDGSVFYTRSGRQNQLFRVPLTGGTPELVLDGGSAAGGISAAALDAEYFYWTTRYEPGHFDLSIWRMARAGGTPGRVADLPAFPGKARLALASDAIIVAGINGDTRLVPLDGSEVRSLSDVPDSTAIPLGVDATGSYWVRLRREPNPGEPSARVPSEIIHVPADGGAASPFFWSGQPPLFQPAALSADPDGGWLVTGFEDFDDGQLHHVVWFVDADGTGRRAACDPSTELTGGSARPAFSADAAHLIAIYAELRTWAVVRIPR
jgi:hypothetical protein